MDNSCNCHSEVSRDGSGQLSRYLKALDPSYAPIDDRSIEDLLVFAKRYANQIRFYDISEDDTAAIQSSQSYDAVPGSSNITSWREFFRRDLAVITASIALIDLEQLKKDYGEQRTKLEERPGAGTFDDLFDPILGMALKIDSWYSLSIPAYPLYTDLDLAITSNLKGQLDKIRAYEEGFKYVDANHSLHLDYSAFRNEALWGLSHTINADISIYQGSETEERIRNGALYVDDIFNSFYSFLKQLAEKSEGYMKFALEQYPAHQPHMALFIAFLRLFRLAQEQMNGLTGKMLDFYYQDVLRLTPKPSIPDKVHLVFELARDVAEYEVPQLTKLNGGKDASGIEQQYRTGSSLVVNQAKVAALKTIFIEKREVEETLAAGITVKTLVDTIYARPVANSKDGFGEKMTDPNPKWPTFGKGAPRPAGTNPCDVFQSGEELADRKDQAKVGFAIASPQLVLRGGKRLIRINFQGGNNAALFKRAKEFEKDHPDQSFFEVFLTGENGWLPIQRRMSDEEWKNLFLKNTTQSGGEIIGIFNPDLANLQSTCYLDEVSSTIAVYLPIAEQAVVAFNAAIHTGYDFKTTLPVALITINQPIELPVAEYNRITVANIQLRVKVGSINPSQDLPGLTGGSFTMHFDGLKNLILQNGESLFTPGKPFDPFTAYPFTGKSLYIGSDEIFNKPFSGTDQLAINIRKTIDSDAEPNDPLITALRTDREKYTVNILEQRRFLPVTRKAAGTNAVIAKFNRAELTANILATAGLTLHRQPLAAVTGWKTDTDKGFIRLDLKLGTNTPSNTMLEKQELAPELEMNEVSVSYDSSVQLEPGIDQFFHVYPFGVAETYLQLTPGGTNPSNALLVQANNLLLPQFNYRSPYASFYNGPSELAAARASTGGVATKMGNLLHFGKSNHAISLMQNAGALTGTTGKPANQYSGAMQQGMLFIGLEKLNPLQSISMLFQFAEGSAENEDEDPSPINWSYLSNNEWRPLSAEHIVSDGTYGFQATGIIKIDVPEDATTNNTIITSGLTWFCASVEKDVDRIPQLIGIVTQAVEAVFEDRDNDASHFDKALAAGSISKLAAPVAQIGKVQQPFASYDGKHQEAGKEFYTRVSERLRHKGRAINAWDYEHLVLDRFPAIYKVKCITHTDPNCLCRENEPTIRVNKTFRLSYNADGIYTPLSEKSIKNIIELLKEHHQLTVTIIAYAPEEVLRNLPIGVALELKARIMNGSGIPTGHVATEFPTVGKADTIDVTIDKSEATVIKQCCGPQIAPGHVLIIPIADLKNRNAIDPLQPKTSRRTLLAIEAYLKTRTSPFVHVHAKNPVYEQILVKFQVKFHTGTDKGYYMKVLNDEIVRYLTPWAFDAIAEVSFNQKVYASSIINFIEERPYVDFITDFEMGICCNECCPPEPTPTPSRSDIAGVIKDSKGQSLPDVRIDFAGEASPKFLSSGDNGSFSAAIGSPTGPGVVIITFSKKGYVTQEIIAGTEITFPVTLYGTDEVFRKVDNCLELERYLQSNPDLNGDIVATPCTSRSILVSAPQHIIVPYQEQDRPSPCEARKLRRPNGESSRGTGVPKASIPEHPAGKITDAAVTPQTPKAAAEKPEPEAKEKALKKTKPVKRSSKPKGPRH